MVYFAVKKNNCLKFWLQACTLHQHHRCLHWIYLATHEARISKVLSSSSCRTQRNDRAIVVSYQLANFAVSFDWAVFEANDFHLCTGCFMQAVFAHTHISTAVAFPTGKTNARQDAGTSKGIWEGNPFLVLNLKFCAGPSRSSFDPCADVHPSCNNQFVPFQSKSASVPVCQIAAFLFFFFFSSKTDM